MTEFEIVGQHAAHEGEGRHDPGAAAAGHILRVRRKTRRAMRQHGRGAFDLGASGLASGLLGDSGRHQCRQQQRSPRHTAHMRPPSIFVAVVMASSGMPVIIIRARWRLALAVITA